MAPDFRDPETIDRVAPSRRPDRRVLMYQSWRSLLFLHWEVAPEVLRAGLPAGLELDLFEGRAFVGLVPFTMRGIRPAYLPAVPWLSNFHETNVRTYVHCGGRDPGVWFFSLDAANPVAVALARSLFHLPYYNARMTLGREPGGVIRYTSRRRRATATTDIRCVPRGNPTPARLGTLDHFLLERYLLYTTSSHRLYSGQVHHTPYPAQGAEILGLEESLIAAAGLARHGTNPLVHFATGVDVEIFGLRTAPRVVTSE